MAKFQLLKNEKIVISIRVDLNKLNEIDEIANKSNISRNELINQCLEYAIKNIEFKDEKNNKENEND